jgi:hypothetical protein
MGSLDQVISSARIRLVVCAFVASLPLLCWAVEAGVALTPSHFLATALMLVAPLAWWRRRLPLRFDLALSALLLFVAVAAVSVLIVQLKPDVRVFAESAHAKSIKQLLGLLFGVGLFVSLSRLACWYGLAPAMVRTHHWTAVVVATLALVQFGIASLSLDAPLANFPVHNSTLGAERPLSMLYGFPRVSLTLVEPSMLATYLMSAWVLWLYSAELAWPQTRKGWVWLASGVLLGVSVVITGSRLAYMVALMMVAGVLVVRPFRMRRALVLAVTLVVGISLTGFKQGVGLIASLLPKQGAAELWAAARPSSPAGSRTGERGVTPSTGSPAESAVEQVEQTAKAVEQVAVRLDISVQQRTASYLVAWQAFRERPWLGTGWGTSHVAMEQYWPASFYLDPGRKTANVMLSHAGTILTEAGLLGLAAVFVFILGIARTLLRAIVAGGAVSARAWGIGAALAAYGVSSFASSLIVYQMLLVWFLLALATAVDDGVASTGAVEPAVVI